MKKIITLLAISLFALTIAVNAQSQKPAGEEKQVSTEKEEIKGPVASYSTTNYDFGNIDLKIPKTAEFILSNKGKEPLLISAAKASCGCTNLKYSQEPILPGKSTTISVTYNAAVKGPFTKTITVTTNADAQPVVLWIRGTVVDPAESQN